MLSLRNLMLALVMAAVAPAAAEASLIMSLSEDPGLNVVTLSYSGSVNTTGFTSLAPVGTVASITPISGLVQNMSSTQWFLTGSTTGTQTFGTGAAINAASSSGSPIYTNFAAPNIIGLPVGYTSGAPITGMMTFTGTFATLGITPDSTFSFDWGGGGAGRTVTLTTSTVPEPATMGVLAIGSVVSGFAYRRRVKKAKLQGAV